MTVRIRTSLIGVMGVLFASCAPDSITRAPLSGDPQLVIIGPTGQTAPVRTSLVVTVQVTGVQQVNGHVVGWVVTGGGGEVFSPAVVSAKPQSGPGMGLQGIASNRWTLGQSASAQTLEARLIDPNSGNTISLGTFTATATAGPAAVMTIVRGNAQSAVVGTTLPVSATVSVTDQYGNGVSGVPITFAVTQGGGSITGANQTTNAQGEATVGTWTLGTVADTGALSASTAATLTGNPARIVALGKPASAAAILTSQRIYSPQIGTTITPVVRVTDTHGNGVANVPVTFTVKTGGGSLNGVGTLAALTNASGHAQINWTTGSSIASNTLQATGQGLTGNPIVFVAIPYDCDCWSTKAPMPTPRRDIGYGLINGRIHTVAGFNQALGGYFSIHETYDIVSNTWSTNAGVGASYAFPMSGVVSGRLYLAGGFGPGILTRNQVYDPLADTWAPLAPMPTPKIEAANEILGGLFYVLGGDNSGNGTPTTNVEAYNPGSDTWIARASMPQARFLTSAGAVDGRIYVFGGHTGGPSNLILSRNDVYDPATNSWATRAPMPTPRAGPTAVSAHGLIYVIGGSGPANLAVVEVYDPATDVWVTRTSMPTARGTPVGVLFNGSIYVLSGRDLTGVQVFGTNEVYRP